MDSRISDKSYYILDVPYMIKDVDGNSATLIIDGVPEYKILSIQLLSDSVMQINHSFNSSYQLQDIEVSWSMFYHKSDNSK